MCWSRKPHVPVILVLTGGGVVSRSLFIGGGQRGSSGRLAVLVHLWSLFGWMIRLRLDDRLFLSPGCFSVGFVGRDCPDRRG